MTSTQPSAIRKAWYRWKALKLPWRKRFLVGLDLQGNTYWEFKDAINTGRMRRIVQYPPATHHSDIKLTPQWHQWLRHTRETPPTLTEQSHDLVRQDQLKVLAARADARWAAKESYLDQPERQQLGPGMEVRDRGGYVGEVDNEGKGVESLIAGRRDVVGEDEVQAKPPLKEEIQSQPPQEERSRIKEQVEKKDPWKVARGGPSEEWQPAAWGGEITPRKR